MHVFIDPDRDVTILFAPDRGLEAPVERDARGDWHRSETTLGDFRDMRVVPDDQAEKVFREFEDFMAALDAPVAAGAL